MHQRVASFTIHLLTPTQQWVYLPVDESWNQLRTWLREQL